jgi:Cu/Ag efflux pump CusA
LQIDTPFDVPVRLGDVAKAHIVSRPGAIKHEDVSRFVDIKLAVNPDTRIVTVMEAVKNQLSHIQFPLEYHAIIFATHEQQHADRMRLLAFSAIALIGILLLFQGAYESWRLAFLSLLTLPLALVGGLVAIVLGAQDLSSILGLLAVLSISARQQILLIRNLRGAGLQQTALSPKEARVNLNLILQAARERFVAMITTTLTMVLVLLPFCWMGDVAGLEILWPAARVIVCGLVTAALVNLFVVPAMCLRSRGTKE